MNISIRILSIATFILWAIIIFFFVTAVYSVMSLRVEAGQVEILPAGNGISFSLPFSINNNGYYELSELNLTTRVTDPDGKMVDQTQTIIPSIPEGSTVNSSHTISVDLDEILSMDHVTLLREDGEFLVEVFTALDFADTVPVQVSMNTTIPWGAPFANLVIGQISVSEVDSETSEIRIVLSFENHAILDIAGSLTLEIYNNADQLIASGVNIIDAPSQSTFSERLTLQAPTADVRRMSSTGDMHLIFETPLFTVDWWEPYG